MGVTKTDIYTKEQNELALLMKALAHPARIAIIQYLIKVNQCICGNIVDEIGLAQATVSQHLKELKAVDLIQGTIEGTSVCYCINGIVWKRFQDELNSLFKSRDPVNNKCC